MTLLERLDGGVNRAGIGHRLRRAGHLQRRLGAGDRRWPCWTRRSPRSRSPPPSCAASTERLSGVAIELASELPKATRSLQEVSPELAERRRHARRPLRAPRQRRDRLARLMEAVVGTIPGMRRVLRGSRRRPPLSNRPEHKEVPWEQRPDAALAVVKATSVPIHDIGTAIYLSPDIMGWAAEWGWSNPFAFYFAGRGGMLGDVGADVVTSAFGWFEPNAVKAMYSEGIGVAGPRRRRPAWPRRTRSGARSTTPTWRGWTRSSPSPRSWSTGSRARPSRSSSDGGTPTACESAAGRAAQLMQILREWRGGIHLVATTAVGLSPLEAILTNEGPGQAKFFGWPEPFPDFAAIKAKHDEAEEITDRLCASALADALDPARFSDFEAGVHPPRRHPVVPRTLSRGGAETRDRLQ